MYKAAFVLIILTSLICGCKQKTDVNNLNLEPEKILTEGQNVPMVNQEAPQAQAVKLQDLEKPSAAANVNVVDNTVAQIPASISFTRPSVENIQQALQNAGIYQGKIDGVLGPKTKKAIEEFQTQNGLTADGRVGPKTWEKLGTFLNKTPMPGNNVTQVTN